MVIPSRLDFTGAHLGMPIVTNSGFDSFGKPLGLGMHEHDGFELTYVFEGRVSWEIATGEVLTLLGEDMAITQPGVPHRGYLNIIQPASIFWLGVNPSARGALIGTGMSRAELRELTSVFSRAGHTVRFTAGALRDDLERLHRTLRTVIEGRALHALARTECRALTLHILTTVTALLSTQSSARSPDSYASEAVAYLKSHMRERLAVSGVADHVGVSTSRLHAVFKDRLGMTPNDYLQRLRVDTACALLSATDTPVTRLALELGFSTGQYFATCFRKYTGMTPRAFRRSVRGSEQVSK